MTKKCQFIFGGVKKCNEDAEFTVPKQKLCILVK